MDRVFQFRHPVGALDSLPDHPFAVGQERPRLGRQPECLQLRPQPFGRRIVVLPDLHPGCGQKKGEVDFASPPAPTGSRMVPAPCRSLSASLPTRPSRGPRVARHCWAPSALSANRGPTHRSPPPRGRCGTAAGRRIRRSRPAAIATAHPHVVKRFRARHRVLDENLALEAKRHRGEERVALIAQVPGTATFTPHR